MADKRHPEDQRKTKKQLVAELAQLRPRVVELETSDAERKRSEEALRESEEKHRTLFETMAQGVVYQDVEGQIISANPAAERNLGLSLDQMQGRTSLDPRWRAVHEDGSEFPGETHPSMVALHTGKEVRNVIMGVFNPQTNEYRWININAVPQFRPGEDAPYQVYTIFDDVTERARAEEALELRVKQLAALSQASQAVTASLELDQVLAKIVSLAGEVVATDYTTVVLMDETGQMSDSADNVPGIPTIAYRIRDEGLTNWIIRSRQTVVVDIGEDGAMTPDLGEGAPRFANPSIVEAGVKSLACLPLMVKDRLLGVLYLHSLRPAAFQRQLSLLMPFANQVAIAIENARLFEEVEKRRLYLENVLVCTPDAVVALDGQNNILEWNPGAERLFGYTWQEVVGRNIDGMIVGPNANAFEEMTDLTRQILAGKSVPPVETVRYRKDDSPVNVIAAGAPILVGNEVIGVVAVYTDITEIKQVEEQLRQQERLAAIGQLSGGIAHDFNNLLTSIMLYAQILRGKPQLPSDFAPAIDNILGESRRAADLVQQILDFSRRSMIERRPVDLIPYTEEVVSILRRTLPESIRLLIEVGADECATPFTVNADPTRIQQVVMNLANNARDAMPEGGELRIGLSKMAVGEEDIPPVAEMAPVWTPDSEWVCLAVSDTGTGMTEEVQSHLFEPFFTTKEVGKGTGLGLAQVHGIVKQHDGYIGVETRVRPNEDVGTIEDVGGTTFRIYFRAHELGEEEEVSEEVLTLSKGKGETILLVEDEEKLREVGQEILESLGYRVLVAADGREALEVYGSAEAVDLMITDVVMPEMGGRHLIQELRKATPGLKALAITGYAIQEDLATLKEEGFLDVVQKPFGVEILARVVRRALDGE